MKKFIVVLLLLASVPLYGASLNVFNPTLPVLTGGQEYSLYEANLSNANHTGTGNVFHFFKVGDFTLDADAIGVFLDIGQGWHYGIRLSTNTPILFGDLPSGSNPGAMLWNDGIVGGLSTDKNFKVYGDLILNATAIRDFDKLVFQYGDLQQGVCVQDQTRIDNGGATKELCQCDGGEWWCTALRRGPVD